MKHYVAILFTALGFSVAVSPVAAPLRGLPTSTKTQPPRAETLVFSGAVTGSWSQTRVVQCDLKAHASQARVTLAGTVTGRAWTFSFAIGSYKGPGTYVAKNARNVSAVLDDGSHNPNTFFASANAGSVVITVAGGEKSGTVEALLWTDTGQSVRISGSWRC